MKPIKLLKDRRPTLWLHRLFTQEVAKGWPQHGQNLTPKKHGHSNVVEVPV